MEFEYLGRVLTASDDVCLEVVGNLMKLRKRWAWMSIILGQEVEDPRTPSKFYKTVVQTTLLFGSETWVMSPRIGGTMGSYHYRVACRMAKMHLRRDITGRWFYPMLYGAIKSVGVEEVETYVLCC